MSRRAVFLTHPDVTIDPGIPVPDWPLSARGLARMRAALALPFVAGLGAVWCSTERKARDGAAILAAARELPVLVNPALGENDREATGYLPKSEFEATADQFFARPTKSVRGWERAVDAQRRIVDAVEAVFAASPQAGDICIVSHGGVGTLLLCHLRGQAINRAHDQPPNNGGNFFAFALPDLLHGWRAIEDGCEVTKAACANSCSHKPL